MNGEIKGMCIYYRKGHKKSGYCNKVDIFGSDPCPRNTNKDCSIKKPRPSKGEGKGEKV